MNSRSNDFPSTIRCAAAILWLGTLVCVISPTRSARAEEIPFEQLAESYRAQVHGLMQRYCLECHSTEAQEGELDLERFAMLTEVRRSPKAWQKVAEMLDNGEMPPKDALQPSPDERRQLRGWVGNYLDAEARASAGDPGRVVMRRLNNFEYTCTIRDLTGVPLSPAREFPIDGAAGEGFINTGESLVMSPALLTKYLDAAKEVAAHAVLLPDGFRFSPATNEGDWQNELLNEIRGMYRRFADSDGRVPLEAYLEATIVERDAVRAGTKTLASVAAERKLSPKYLAVLWQTLNADPQPTSAADYPGSVIDGLRVTWRSAKAEDVAALAALIRPWQSSLWRTNTVGHMKPWHQPVDPVIAAQEVRVKLQPAPVAEEVTVYLAAGDAGDGHASDAVVWQEPRLESPGRAPLALRDVRQQSEYLLGRRKEVLAATARYLAAAGEAQTISGPVDSAALAQKHQIDPEALVGWLDYLGIVPQGTVTIDSRFTNQIKSMGGYNFVQGWGPSETPNLIANASDQEVHVPGTMKPHRVAVHPAPTLQTVVGWQSPVAATLQVTAHVARAHTACGNGITWSLELRRGLSRTRLAGGTSDGLKTPAAGPLEGIKVHPGDLVSLAIGPRDGNHACDLTEIDLTLTTTDGERREWQLAGDISSDVLAGNPHADRLGNQGVWHFYTEPATDGQYAPVIPPNSKLAQWRDAQDPAVKQALAQEVQQLLTGPRLGGGDESNAVCFRQVTSLIGPVLSPLARAARTKSPAELAIATQAADPTAPAWGVDPALFGKRTDGQPISPNFLAVEAPSVVAIRLPAELVAGGEFVATCTLDAKLGAEGSVQPRVAVTAPEGLSALLPGVPLIARDGSQARARIVATLAEVRRLFPPAVCYPRIVPIDEAVTLQLLHRDDDALSELMLDDAEHAHLDKLWSELRYITQDALRLKDAFHQLMEYATQDSDPGLFEPYRKQIYEGADAFRQSLLDTAPVQVDRAVEFASRAYRRPLTAHEEDELRTLYRTLRSEDLSHEEALRLVLARVFVSPAFLYRVENAPPGSQAQPVSDWELASRLSYFLWSSQPDDELRRLAAAGELRNPDVLASQARRMMLDDRARSLATEFACQWLDVRDFDKLDEKSERHFPTFVALRGDMYEESVRFFADLFQRDGSVMEILDTDHTFLNGPLAEHYGIPGVTGPEWRRVDGVRQYGRGGILGLSTTLAKNSGASRTSPILRGNWLLEMVLGEKLPKPPKGVPVLPDDEGATEGLTVRQLIEKHRNLAQCATCHAKLDPFGFALERYDAIGRKRDKDLGDRPIDTAADLPDGTHIDGLADLRNYLLTQRKDQFLRTFSRKLLGYALGRGVQLSDQPLVEEMVVQLAKQDYRFSAAVDAVVRSQQFRYHRGVAEAEDQ
jgi:Protein of unknown function (DUF1592)/Protein of unknown function (DUF1588)/Protein of unknown function (DUF1585)/Protein of unknown function (DUF1587)/Protein of unknown function (DUF1595)/Planctomycete cytochrome C